MLSIINKKFTMEHSYIRKTALDCRVKLQPEEIVPGVICNSAELIIFEAVKCLINDLVRNAKTRLVFEEGFR